MQGFNQQVFHIKMIEAVDHPDGGRMYQGPKLSAVGVPHAWTTRIVGAGQSGLPEHIIGDRELVTLRQVHGREIHQAPATTTCAHGKSEGTGESGGVGRGRESGEMEMMCVGGMGGVGGDGLVSRDPAQLIAMRMADCGTVLLADRTGRYVAAVHAGWRGVVAGVVGHAVQTMQRLYGVEASQLVGGVGPCIGRAHFEVGHEVAEQFCAVGLGSCVHERPGQAKPHIDLTDAIAQQLADAGVRPDAIDLHDRCTFRDADEFYSYRREGKQAGRMLAMIGARAE